MFAVAILAVGNIGVTLILQRLEETMNKFSLSFLVTGAAIW
jgi:hypothetical protein